MTLRRSLAGVLAAGALLTATAGVLGAGIAWTAGPASAGPAEDCAAVRARDHQIYLNLIASLPPGAPIPPEYINPCLTATPTTTAAPTTTVGLPGAQAPGGGPNVGANAPTNFPTYNGTPIVPVPTIEVPPIASESPTSETGAGAPSTASASMVPSPTSTLNPTSGEGTTTDRGPGPIPAATPNTAPGQQETNPTVTTSGLDEDDSRDRYLELVLVGAAAFTAGGIGVRGRRSPFGPRIPLNGRTPESILSQAVGTLASPLMQYAKGGQSKITVTEPGGGRRTFFLIHDETSSHEAEIPVDVPPGGHMSVNPDGSVTVFDADGNPVSVVAAPWAYDANGDPVPTDYEVRDGHLIQKVYADEATAYPILADPPDKKVKAPASVASKQVTKSSNTTSKPNSMTSRTSPQKPQNSGNSNSGNTSGATNSGTTAGKYAGTTTQGSAPVTKPGSPNQSPRTTTKPGPKPAPTSQEQAANQLAQAHGEVSPVAPSKPAQPNQSPRTTTSPGPKPAVSPEQQAANRLAAAHGDVPDGFTGNVPLPGAQPESGQQHPNNTNGDSNFTAAEQFIYDEMTVNSQSRTVKTIHQLLEPPRWYEFGRNPGGDVNAAMVMWFAKVAPKQDWDHKPQIEDRLGLQSADDYFFKQPDADREVFYDIYSNLHYGYVGRAAGFDAETLISGASLGESLLVGKDDYGDQITMRKGIELYDQYGESLTQQQLHQGIIEAMDEMQQAQSQGRDVPQIRPTK